MIKLKRACDRISLCGRRGRRGQAVARWQPYAGPVYFCTPEASWLSSLSPAVS